MKTYDTCVAYHLVFTTLLLYVENIRESGAQHDTTRVTRVFLLETRAIIEQTCLPKPERVHSDTTGRRGLSQFIRRTVDDRRSSE